MTRHYVQTLFTISSLYKQHVKFSCVKVDFDGQACSEKYWSIRRELQYLLSTHAWLLAFLLFVTSGLSDTVSNPVSITPFKCTTRLHYEIVAHREIYLKGESTLLSHKFCANPVESIQWICRKATEMTLANLEGTTEVLPVLLAMYPVYRMCTNTGHTV